MSKITSINVLGITFNNLTLEEAKNLIFRKYKKDGKVFIVTANPEIVMHTTRDKNYKNIVENSDITVADGIGVVIASKLLRNPLKERVAGFDLTMELLKEANQQRLKLFLLGAKDEVVIKTVKTISINFPNIDIAGYNNGFFDINDSTIIDKVGKTDPDIVLVATGFPRQEIWIKNYHDKYSNSIAMGVGGTFDVIAGVSKRAPKWVIASRLEWAYRLFKEPHRFFRMLDLPKFMIMVIKEKFFKEVI